MDGENNGKPYEQMDDLGGNTPYFWKHPFYKYGHFLRSSHGCGAELNLDFQLFNPGLYSYVLQHQHI